MFTDISHTYVTEMAYPRGFISSVVDGNNTRKEKRSLKKDIACEIYIHMSLLSFYLKTANRFTLGKIVSMILMALYNLLLSFGRGLCN